MQQVFAAAPMASVLQLRFISIICAISAPAQTLHNHEAFAFYFGTFCSFLNPAVHAMSNSSAFGFTATPDTHRMLQSRILALAQLAKPHTERFTRNSTRLNCYRNEQPKMQKMTISVQQA